ncbi:MAG TPA: serine/threonine-protein kinase [Trebonia sp.]
MPQSIVGPLRRWDPERIGPYTIIGRLGAGAMGQVFLARSTAGRLVAVKTIRIELAEEADFRARFAREVAAASRVSGVFTAAVIEADPDADLPWVATAYVPAPSLSTLVRAAGPLPVPAVRWLAAGCAEALQSIHGAGLLHRDVKPSNVLVAPDGPRVIDFGVARAAERVQLTATRAGSGTPAYMAPEQARDASQASPASDVFSLGATLVYAATGHPPYQGETVMDILVRLATEPPDLTGLPEELYGLIAACLERVPRDRPSDTAILARLGSFALLAGPGHDYLPDDAMKVIGEYQRGPLLPAGPARDDGAAGDDTAREHSVSGATAGSGAASWADDVTARSGTALPGFRSLGSHGARPDSAPGRARHRRFAPRQEAARSGTALRAPLPLWAGAVLSLLLLGAGAALGIWLHGSGAQAASPLGPVLPPPATCPPPGTSSNPELCVSQPWGDGATVFILHGSGFTPDAEATVTLTGVHAAPVQVTVDAAGMFNYAIDQGHRFFPGPVPAGTYRAVATVPGRGSATASFRVYPKGSGPPLPIPAGPPPAR